MYQMNLQWKEHNVDLQAFDASLKVSYPHYAGNQAHSILELWFNEEPSQDDKDLIQMMWEDIGPDHAMAQSYKSRDQIQADKEAKKASAKAKLAALGLSEDELKAMGL
jgi:hypothetical protein